MDLDSHPDAQRWDKRYADKSEQGPASRVLSENLHLLPAQGKALDLACGLGANALLLAQHGLNVDGWDISRLALEKLHDTAMTKGLNINCQQRDLHKHIPDRNSYDVIVVSYFLQRSLLPHLIEALKPNGLLFYQTFSRLRVDDSGPANPEFRLAENELLHELKDLNLRLYREEGFAGDIQQGFRNEVLYIGQK